MIDFVGKKSLFYQAYVKHLSVQDMTADPYDITYITLLHTYITNDSEEKGLFNMEELFHI